MSEFTISRAREFVGKTVQLKGWVYNKRASGKKLRFLVMRDGTGLMQGILFKGECDESSFEAFDQLTQESSVIVTGSVREEPRSPGGFEMGVQSLEIIQIAEPYPITPKEHGIEFLLENRHLWVRSQRPWNMLRVRSQVIRSIHDFFHQREFVHFDSPILSANSCEGTSTLFETNYFDQKAYLSQSGQLFGEIGAMAFGKIYVFSPAFRAEKSKTRKHLTEFWMVEPEMAYVDLKGNMDLAEDFVCHIVESALERCSPELKALERDTEVLKKIQKPFPRISYDEALKILEKKDLKLEWGEDFGAPHEAALGEEFGKPVFVHHMPAQIKAFYFKQSDEVWGPGTRELKGKYALGCDLIAPDGYGEIVGGGEREADPEVLKSRILAHDLALEDYNWYLDLRRFGSVPHSGFGLGVERMVAWITGAAHLREVIPLPRMMNHLKP